MTINKTLSTLQEVLQLRRDRRPETNAQVHIKAGDAARDSRQWDRAELSYKAALELRPDHEGIWVQYGHSLKEQGRPAEAEQAYRRALQLNPANSDTFVQLGHALKLQNLINPAIEAYTTAYNLDNQNMDAVAELSGRHVSSSSIGPDALAQFEEAQELKALMAALRRANAESFHIFSQPPFLPK